MQEITFDELSTLKQPSASLRTALLERARNGLPILVEGGR